MAEASRSWARRSDASAPSRQQGQRTSKESVQAGWQAAVGGCHETWQTNPSSFPVDWWQFPGSRLVEWQPARRASSIRDSLPRRPTAEPCTASRLVCLYCFQPTATLRSPSVSLRMPICAPCVQRLASRPQRPIAGVRPKVGVQRCHSLPSFPGHRLRGNPASRAQRALRSWAGPNSRSPSAVAWQ